MMSLSLIFVIASGNDHVVDIQDQIDPGLVGQL